MNKSFLIIFVGLIVFFAGCAKEETTELQFKNDVVTIENYFVSNVAPYEKGETSIQFDVYNNGDQKIPYLEVDFFDTPGFKVDDINDPLNDNPIRIGLKCEPIGHRDGNKCIFNGDNAIESLDTRSITLQLRSTEGVSSPTPHTLSFAVRYTYFGSKEASIPIIDGNTRKKPLTEFRQSDSSIGPIALDIDPSIEREIVSGDKTIKESWGVGGKNPLPFLTKFKFKNVDKLSEKTKDVDVTLGSLRLNISGLAQEGTCDFCDVTDEKETECIGNFKSKIKETFLSDRRNFYKISPAHEIFTLDVINPNLKNYNLYSKKSMLVPHDMLVCTFRPNQPNQPEYSAIISAFFAYKYEFIKSQNFVIQPLPESR